MSKDCFFGNFHALILSLLFEDWFETGKFFGGKIFTKQTS